MIKYTKSFLKKLNKENIIGKFFEERRIIAILKQEAELHFKHSISEGEAYELLKQLEKDGVILTKEQKTTGVISGSRIEKKFKIYGINMGTITQKDNSQYLMDFFTEESIKKLEGTLTSVDDILEDFAKEIRNITKGKADFVLQKIPDFEAKEIFEKQYLDDTYIMVIRYVKNGEQKRNKFCAISYSDSFPALVANIRYGEHLVAKIENPDEFKRYLKAVCNDEAVLTSIRSAIRLEDKPENFSEIEILRRVAKEIVDNDNELTKNALTFLEYWKNNYKK